MKTINLIIGALSTIGALYSIYEGNTTNGFILLILAKLYTDGSTNR
jgi:hypothetical protein